MKQNGYVFFLAIVLVWVIVGNWERPAAESNSGHQLFMPLIRNTFSGIITRISVAPDGTEGNSGSFSPSISEDGRYIAFHSAATNFVPNDTNGQLDVFIYDQETGEVDRISVASDGTQGNWGSHTPFISGDGRYIAFTSEASNLVTGDTNDMIDVFVHDRQTGQTKRISVASDGSQTNDFSSWHSISLDGRYIAFASWATNLVSNDTNNDLDIFVHDQQTAQTIRVSVSSNGVEANGGSAWSSISGDGRFVVFHSSATNLVSNDTNEVWDVFLHDQQTHQTYRVSIASDRTEGNNYSSEPSISITGRYVIFSSSATNLIKNDANEVGDIFVHDLWNGQTSRVSISSNQTEANNHSYKGVISTDGRFVSFYSNASNLVVGDTNGVLDVFVYDRYTGEIKRISLAVDGTEANGNSLFPALSANGQYIVFYSIASNIVGNDSNQYEDVFIYEQK